MKLVNRLPDQLRELHDSYWRPTTESLRRWALAAIAVNALITVTGAAVRVTGSGLGCPTWPKCTPDSFIPAPEHSTVHTAIEFGNRLLTFVLLAIAVGCVIAAHRLGRDGAPRPSLVRLAWLQPIGIVAQAVWGGIVVLTELDPLTVGVHFLLSTAMIAASVALYVRCGESDGRVRSVVHKDIRTLGFVVAASVLALLVAGVVVTGTGPHAGDEIASRLDLDLEAVVRLHTNFAYITAGLTFALLFALHVTDAPSRPRRLALLLLGLEFAQGAIGYAQWFSGVPAGLVILHVLGSTLIWLATLFLVYALRSREAVADAPPVDELRQVSA
ncbi:cytochrome b561 [Thermobispora bispora]|uniref:Cytochrome oxidase assembly n=1 Tax=Thermobispora bispora (strain ATCC 19993 / DSM 43833 / CBS 139.67 / JCM 10125 / KCTC 9307 / NBRC 14880 / R51) TaxID=469371 RepID=D6Y1T3_THEBD|nr:cytochrome oxidase assembly [Thermobispora bispora DSM 43833]MBO2474575.1 heme A synthase [Actinomycetales bacterium]QSI48469.1 heme A synthase [Thermobispora bispora]